ncbi:MAG: D-2-hydroxyacid dehydrogenase [Mycobacteriales bacterium]
MDDVRRALPPAERDRIELVGVDATASEADLSRIEAAIRWDLDDAGFRRLLDQAPKLRWLHSPGAGVERWPLGELADRGIVLTNGAGVFAIPIAEWVLTAMLTAVKRTVAVNDAQRAHRWATDIQADELYGKTLLVLGTGGIGAAVIARASGFGMRILAGNRSGRPVGGAQRTIKGAAWRDALRDADFVVVTVPLTEETTGMIGADELRSFKPGAWLLNVGRGATIDEPALIDALTHGSLGGAALDAWTTEPLPPDDLAWDASNMILSPHMSGSSPANRARILALFMDNLRRFVADQPLINTVDLSAGY